MLNRKVGILCVLLCLVNAPTLERAVHFVIHSYCLTVYVVRLLHSSFAHLLSWEAFHSLSPSHRPN